MKKRGKTILTVLVLLVIFFSVNVLAGDIFSLQGNVNDASGTKLSSGGVVVEIWDGPDVAGSNLIYNSTDNFTGSANVSDGKFDIILGNALDQEQLNLEYGRIYYMDIFVAGENMNFSGNERQPFMSSVGTINSSFLNASNDYTMGSLTVTNITASTLLLNVSHGTDMIIVNSTGIGLGSNLLYVDPINNRVGIGTTSPGNTLHVSGGGIRVDAGQWIDIGGNSVLAADTSNVFLRNVHAAGGLVFEGSDGTDRMIITSTGNVGIGTSSPTRLLHLVKSENNETITDLLALENTNASGDVGNGSGPGIMFRSADNAGEVENISMIAGVMENVDNGTERGAIAFYTGYGDENGQISNLSNSERMRINETGVTVAGELGVDLPLSKKFAIREGSNYLTVDFQQSAANQATYDTNSVHRFLIGGALKFNFNGAEADFRVSPYFYNDLWFDPGVDIGETYPARNLYLNGMLSVDNSSAVSSAYLNISDGANQWLLVEPDGDLLIKQNVGIGTTTPTRLLHLVKSENNETVTDLLALDLTNSSGDVGNGSGPGIMFRSVDNAGEVENISMIAGVMENVDNGTERGALVFYTGYGDGDGLISNLSSSERMRVTSEGNVGIGTSSPGATLEVTNSTAATLLFNVSDGDDAIIVNATGTNFDAGTLYVDEINNRVGIGTTAPIYPLHVKGGDILFDNNKWIMQEETSGTAVHLISRRNDNNVYVGGGAASNTGNVIIMTSVLGTQVAWFTTTGRVGIRTATPSMVLDVNGDANLTGTTYIGNSTLYVDGSNVGIGTTTPTRLLHLVKSENNETVTDLLSLDLTNSSGDVGNGSGPSIMFRSADNAGEVENISMIAGVMENVDNGTERGAIAFYTGYGDENGQISNLSSSEKMRINETGVDINANTFRFRKAVGSGGTDFTIDLDGRVTSYQFTSTSDFTAGAHKLCATYGLYVSGGQPIIAGMNLYDGAYWSLSSSVFTSDMVDYVSGTGYGTRLNASVYYNGSAQKWLFVEGIDNGPIVSFLPNGNGSVGIGTSSPTRLLHLVKSENNETVTDLLSLDLTNSSGDVGNGSGPGIMFRSVDNAGEVENISMIAGVMENVDNGTERGAIAFYTGYGDSDGLISNLSSSERMRINTSAVDVDSGTLFVDADNNRIGIGTTAPSQTLDVSGDIQMGTAAGGAYLMANGGGGIRLRYTDNNMYIDTVGDMQFRTSGDNVRMVIRSVGNVGIGTTSPTRPLHLVKSENNETVTDLLALDLTNSSGDVGNGSGPGIMFRSADNAGEVENISMIAGVMEDTSNASERGAIAFYTGYGDENGQISNLSSSEKMRIDGSGNVGIGTTPDVKLHVQQAGEGATFKVQDSDGACTHDPDSGSEVVACSSDIRMGKINIRDADKSSVLDDLDRIKIRDYELNKTGITYRGVVAQELLETNPDRVITDDDGMLMVVNPTPWELLAGIQELKQENDALKSELCRKDSTYSWCKKGVESGQVVETPVEQLVIQPEELVNETPSEQMPEVPVEEAPVEETPSAEVPSEPVINNAPVIDSFMPETVPVMSVGESQEFTVVASDADNDQLSLQWFVDNVAVAGQTQNSFTYTASGVGSFVVKVLVTDGKDYVTKEWSLTVEQHEKSYGITGAAVSIVNKGGNSLLGWLKSLF